MVAVVLVLVVAASVGARLIGEAGQAPAAIETALRIQSRAAVVLGIVANLESDRRGYALTGMHEHLAALQHDHAQIHDALQALRDALGPSVELRARVDSAEAAIGFWSDEFASQPARPRVVRTDLARDRELLGAARRHLGFVVSVAERDAQTARARVRQARSQARRLWVATTGLTLLVIAGLALVARRRQLRLQQAAAETALVVEALPFALVSLDRDGVIRHASGQARAILGSPSGRLVGRRFGDFFASLDQAEIASELARASGGTHVVCQAQVRSEFEAARVLSLAFAPIVERGATVGVSVVVRDATEEQALKTQARRYDRLARVGAAAASIARELDGPLATIASRAASIDASRLEEKGRAAVRTILAEALGASGVVRSLRRFARRQAHQHQPTAIGRVLEQAVELRRYDPRSQGIDFAMEVAPRLPAVIGDEQELTEVFLNLLVNAERAVRDQRVRRVAIRAEERGRRVLVSVEDTGPGIPDDKLQTVFEPFYTTKPEGEAVGLGLALAHGVVREHQGEIWAERAAGGGARFVVALPALRRPKGESIPSPTPSARPAEVTP
jgi:PAS domain S-box-containing protein